MLPNTGFLSRSFNSESSRGNSRTASTTSDNSLDDECLSSQHQSQDQNNKQAHLLQRQPGEETASTTTSTHILHPRLNQTNSTPTQSSTEKVESTCKSKPSLSGGVSSIIFRTSSSPIPRRSPVTLLPPEQSRHTPTLLTPKNSSVPDPCLTSGNSSSLPFCLKKGLTNCHAPPSSPATRTSTSTSGSSDSKEDSPRLPPSPVLRTLSRPPDTDIESLFKRTGSKGSQKKPLKKSTKGLLLDTSSSEEEDDDIDTTGQSFQRKKSSSTDDGTPSPRTPNSFKILSGIDRNQATAFDFPPSPYYSSRPSSFETARYSERQSSDDTQTSSFRSRSTSSEVFEGEPLSQVIPSLAPIPLVRNRRSDITPLKKQQAIAEESTGWSSSSNFHGRNLSTSTVSSNIFLSVSTADQIPSSLKNKRQGDLDSKDQHLPLNSSPGNNNNTSNSPILVKFIQAVSPSCSGSRSPTPRGGNNHSVLSNGSSSPSSSRVVTDISQTSHHQTSSFSSSPSHETVISHPFVTSSITGSRKDSGGEEDLLLSQSETLFRKVTIRKRVAPIPPRSASAEPSEAGVSSASCSSRPSSSEPLSTTNPLTNPIVTSPSRRSTNLPLEVSKAFNLRSSCCP